jgi:hypothetical protein
VRAFPLQLKNRHININKEIVMREATIMPARNPGDKTFLEKLGRCGAISGDEIVGTVDETRDGEGEGESNGG